MSLKRLAQVMQNGTRRERKKLALDPPRDNVHREVKETVEEQQPHGREMPLQSATKPSTQRDTRRNHKTLEYRRCIVDPPSRQHHQDRRERVQPVRDSYPNRLNGPRGNAYAPRFMCCVHLGLHDWFPWAGKKRRQVHLVQLAFLIRSSIVCKRPSEAGR